MNLNKAKDAGDLAGKIERATQERDGYAKMLDEDVAIANLVVRDLTLPEAKAVIAAILTVYDDRISTLNDQLAGL